MIFAWLLARPWVIGLVLLGLAALGLGIEDRILVAQNGTLRAHLQTCHLQNAQTDALLRSQNAAIAAQHAQLVAAEKRASAAEQAAQRVHTRTITIVKRIQAAQVPVQCHAAVAWGAEQAKQIAQELNHAAQ